ncbi:YbfB/YjiJ family MFS transporter [Pseudoxanthobacter sp. M-2]|uniref:YbfB/YjiJ family MFS transporter n=1 Tax=Pseudoxanthobacter sp. M-2 TaxID=3078754 RepID=UPI0038FC61E3
MAERREAAREVATALGLAAGPAVALGIARFGYGLLVPAMQGDLGWSYSQAGLANAANALGYLVGALLSAAAIGRFGARRTAVIGLVVTVATTAATGLVSDFLALCVLRFLPGLSGAFVFVAGGVMAARLAAERPGSRGLLIGLFYVGPGVGMAIAGLLLPGLVDDRPDLWRWGWVAAAVAAAVLTPAFVLAARQVPAPARAAPGTVTRPGMARFVPALASYFVYALGMIGYLTFVVADLVADGASAAVVTAFWVCLAVASFPGPWIWQRLLDRADDGRAMAVLCAMMATGVGLSIVGGLIGVFASALFTGVAMLSVVAATTSLVRKGVAPVGWPAGIAVFTVAFGVGQTIGPWLAGVVSDRFGGLDAGLTVSGALMALAAVVALLQKPVSASPERP